jgi:hypothetical protein
MNPSRRYLTILSLAVLGVMSAIAFINGVIDPWGLYHWYSRPGLNANKPRQIFNERIIRAADITRERPGMLLMGTSRAQVGLSPDAPALKTLPEKALNIGFSDGTAYEALRYLQHAHAQARVNYAVIGADFLSFSGATRKGADFTEERLAVDADFKPHWLFRLADVPNTLLSLDALRASRRTTLEQYLPSYFYPGGRRHEHTMAERIEEQGGMRGTFLWSEHDYLREYACFRPFSAVLDKGAGSIGGWKNQLAATAKGADAMDDFRKIVTFAREQGIKLFVYTSPSHARAQVLIAQAGLWPAYEQWKTDVVMSLAANKVPLWEFGGADPRFTAEVVPAQGDKSSRMKWYWESSHYRREMGDVALERVLGAPEREETRGFGVPLTPANVVPELERVKAEIEAWKTAHPEELQEMEAQATHVLAEERAKCPTPPPRVGQPLKL